MPSSHQYLLCQYRYDALDRLIGHALVNEAQHQRFYCKSRLATEIQGALRQSIVQHADFLLAQQQRSANTLDTTMLATDQQRSVLYVVSNTDQQQQSIAYSPYGHRRSENGLLSLLGFNGERSDPVTGHYLLGKGYRAFNPVLMRFNSPDRFSPFDRGGLNAYAYCLGDPVNLVDPTGQSVWGRVVATLQGHLNWAKAHMTYRSAGLVSRKQYVTGAKLFRAKRKLDKETLSTVNFETTYRKTLASLSNEPVTLTSVPTLTTQAANKLPQSTLANLNNKLDFPKKLEPDRSTFQYSTPSGQKTEHNLSLLEAAARRDQKGNLMSFQFDMDLGKVLQTHPKPAKIIEELHRLRDKHDLYAPDAWLNIY